MKTLLLMRHAKSSWKETKKDEDKFRPLTKKGEKEAHKMAELLEEEKILPEVILTSTAVRARKTADVFMARCCTGEITFIAMDALYMAEAHAVVDALKDLPDRVDKVMVIGHNPGLECLLQHLTGAVESLSTASVACLKLPIDCWSTLSIDTLAEKWERWKPKDA